MENKYLQEAKALAPWREEIFKHSHNEKAFSEYCSEAEEEGPKMNAAVARTAIAYMDNDDAKNEVCLCFSPVCQP